MNAFFHRIFQEYKPFIVIIDEYLNFQFSIVCLFVCVNIESKPLPIIFALHMSTSTCKFTYSFMIGWDLTMTFGSIKFVKYVASC